AENGERWRQRNVAALEAERFRDAQTGAIEKRQQRTIARRKPFDVVLAGHFNGARRLALAQRPRQAAANPRRADIAGGSALQDVLAGEIAKEAADRCERALHALGAEALMAAHRDE